MFIMWKLNGKLTHYRRVAKSKTRVIPWRNLNVADRADWGTCASEKLSAVTGDARGVVGIISHVGKVSCLLPVPGWNLVAGIANLFMLFCRVEKL
jgi:uncharacterized membrane protein